METAVWDRTSIRHALEQHRVSTVTGQLFKLETDNKKKIKLLCVIINTKFAFLVSIKMSKFLLNYSRRGKGCSELMKEI